MSMLTAADIEALQTSDLDRKTPFVIRGVSQSQFSVARHYGGAKFNDASYTYDPKADELVRDDVLKWLKSRRNPPKAKKKSKK